MKKSIMVILTLGLVLGLAIGAGAASFSDNFNRADAGDLGPNWTAGYGVIGISGNRAASWAFQSNYAVVKGFSDDYRTTKLCVDAVSTSTDLNYVALMLGYADANHSIFVKVQDQEGSDSLYEHAAFYYGNNGGGFFFTITPFDAGRISVYALDANTIRLDIDSNFDGSPDQTYSYAYSNWEIANLGSGIGLGMYGPALADNYCANAVVPLPGALLLTGTGLLGLMGWRRRLGR